jgi:predicted nucleotidyltransferase
MNAAERQLLFARVRAALEHALPQAWAAYVYGSAARGDDWPDSDLDVAVLPPPCGRGFPDLLGLMAELSNVAGRDVEVVDLREAGGDLVHEVLRDGQPLFVREPDAVLEWEAEQMSDYADFNPRRAAILDVYLHAPLTAPAPTPASTSTPP